MKIYKVRVNNEVFQVEIDEVSQSSGSISTGNAASSAAPAASAPSGKGTPVKAPLQGTINEIKVQVGASVQAGDTVVILEAMKMKHEVKSAQAGKVVNITVDKGAQVETGQVLVEIQ